MTGSSYWPVIHRLPSARDSQIHTEWHCLFYDLAQVHPRNCWFPIFGVQWPAIIEYSRMISVLISGLVVSWGVWPCQVLPKSGDMSHSPLFMPKVERKRKLPFQAPSSDSSDHVEWDPGGGGGHFYETMSFMMATKQNQQGRARHSKTMDHFPGHPQSGRGWLSQRVGLLIYDCRTLTSMTALIMPHFRHIIQVRRRMCIV